MSSENKFFIPRLLLFINDVFFSFKASDLISINESKLNEDLTSQIAALPNHHTAEDTEDATLVVGKYAVVHYDESDEGGEDMYVVWDNTVNQDEIGSYDDVPEFESSDVEEIIDWLKQKLVENNFEITCIHGKLTQKEREDVIKDFRDGKTRILLTTDLLSRGIDIPQVNMVVNYDLPLNKETYIHRIGRCGRFDKKGIAITMVRMNDQSDIKTFNKMKHFYKMDIKEMPDSIEKYL